MLGDKSEFKDKTVLFRSELRAEQRERERELIDEPVVYTVGRELKSICKRTSLVFVPCLGKKAGFLNDCRLVFIRGLMGTSSVCGHPVQRLGGQGRDQ